MDQNEDPRELELKIEQAERIAARIGDPTTYERLKAWADELRGRLRRRLDARRTKQAIGARAHETAAPQTVTWSFGFRPSSKSLSANSKDELSVFHAAALSSLSAARHDLQHIIRQRSLRLRLIRQQDHRHGFRKDQFDDGIRRRRQKTIDPMRAGIGFDLVPRSPLNSVQMPAKQVSGRLPQRLWPSRCNGQR